jgi:formylglycine-generating enzyme required for sulfatase activity
VKSGHFPWLVWIAMVVAVIMGCGKDEGTQRPQNTAPSAVFSIDPPSGTTATVFQLDASGCTDTEDSTSALQVRWDWESDGTWDTEYTTTKTASHQYGSTGTKTVTLGVKDTGGLTDTETRAVPVGNGQPTAAFTVAPESGTTATMFEFDASGSTDTEDPASALEVRWDWESDGTWDTEYSMAKTASHQHASPGTKTVTLEVRDTGGLTDTETHTVAVGNGPPTAAFTVAPESGTTATVFEFDASGSADAEDPASELEVRWDWEGDGTWDTAYSRTKAADHQYGAPGTKTVTLEVKDAGGLTDTETHTIAVGNGPPTAAFTVEPSSGTKVTVFQFDASGSTDTEDPTSLLQVRWDWDDDGVWDTGYSTTKTLSHQYTTLGTKTIKLEVRDAGGLVDTETHTVTVSNTAPAAAFTADPSSGTIATVFQVDASGSTDAEDPTSLLQVRWDWDDDGTWDTDYSRTKTASHQYASPGAKTIRLEVRDTDGLTNPATHTVTVSNTAPMAAFTVDPSSGTVATTFQFDASWSTDMEDPTAELQVRWDWDDDGTWDTDYTATTAASHQYTTPGTKTIALEVKDSGGLTDTETHTVSVDNGPPTAAFTIAPSSGTPETLFEFDASGSTDTEDPASALQVRWDWENDGTWDTGYTTTKTAVHQFGTPGAKTVKLEAMDTGGLLDTQTHTLGVAGTEGLVLVQAGAFTMGGAPGELCRDPDEVQHEVTLTHAFYISATEITQAQWQAMMGWDDSRFDGLNRPVETVNWFDAVMYCDLRSTAEGLTPVYTITGATYNGNHITSANVDWNQNANGYRLPTEAEWEYACRAGSTGAFCNGDISQCGCGSEPGLGAVGWYCGNSDDQTQDVGTKTPNAWGIYDMHGNVWEWCWDVYDSYGGAVTDPTGPASGIDRITRGGGWVDYAEYCRSANRVGGAAGYRADYIGVRIVRTAP